MPPSTASRAIIETGTETKPRRSHPPRTRVCEPWRVQGARWGQRTPPALISETRGSPRRENHHNRVSGTPSRFFVLSQLISQWQRHEQGRPARVPTLARVGKQSKQGNSVLQVATGSLPWSGDSHFARSKLEPGSWAQLPRQRPGHLKLWA